MTTTSVRPGCQFASDNTAPMCPEAWSAMQQANAGCEASYGNDPWTARACDLIRQMVDGPAEVFFVFNGTAANSLALAAMCQSYHATLCHEAAHVETDECGAPEFFSNGTKLLGLQQNLWVKAGSEYASARPPRVVGSRIVIAQRGKPSSRRIAAEIGHDIAASAA